MSFSYDDFIMADDKKLAVYYKKIRPTHEFIKEVYSRMEYDKLQSLIQDNAITSSEKLDGAFLMESREFLRLSIVNLLAFKKLMCGNYSAWGRVTLYYSYFYAINSLLRLVGKAIVHAVSRDEKRNPFLLVRQKNPHEYKLENPPKNEHQSLWNIFSNTFPDLLASASKYFIDERVKWNYDLFFASQSLNTPGGLNEAEIHCKNNFLDGNSRNFSTFEATEDYDNTLTEYGNDVIFAGYLIKKCLYNIKNIAKHSDFKSEYIDFFNSLLKDVEKMDSEEETKNEIKSWIKLEIDEITQT